MKTQATLHCYGFSDHERTIIKSLLQTFGELPNTQWRYGEHESADVVLIDCDNPQAVQDLADGMLNTRFLVACSSRQYRCPGARDLLRKPLRPRELVTLLTSLDDAPGTRPNSSDAYPLLT
ncbi:hypothetical protein EV700_0331 [Fluviicoccus keumensis]|uniref:Response regulatory domain-containing protein n=1 Tax=Fluviicoccus keumensis TaxID=1435465 RepID=A0A4Q7Z9Z3_9GAMM|nr:hypothetical protein [Fluviicoccus keumensis]RZU47370.1 hypothetical protein EV700_0331 [Fluviicoccus keumensis]